MVIEGEGFGFDNYGDGRWRDWTNLLVCGGQTGEVVIVVAAITGDLLEDDGSGGGGVVEDGDLVHVLDDGAGLEDGRLEAVEVEAVGLLEVLELVSLLGGDDGGGTGAEAAVVDAGGGGGVVGEFDEEFGGGDGGGLELFGRGAVGGGDGGEYSLTYIPQKAVKGQALVDFLADHPSDDIEKEIIYIGIIHWKMMFDGSKTSNGVVAGVVLISPTGNIHQFVFQIGNDCSNDQAEYEALIVGIEILLDMHVTTVQIFKDSQLVIKQLPGELRCCAPSLETYFSIASYLLKKFDDVTITHVPILNKGDVNVMAQLASGLSILDGVIEKWTKMSKHFTIDW
ncbi:hypothetical protein RJ640_003354 [Escallonia rubra]|uniref:RNase H type-1 domain-containing protein n=1 Tax=Escallonia rubra TaxID=112253 RepID=A0AA88QI57_9ASTE|nr:hypothetical protein RJ640_003354 [Escallonia rubra]